jgi:hypothetical protein
LLSIKSVTDLSKEAKKDENTAKMCQEILERGIDFLSNPKGYGGSVLRLL